MDDIYVASLKCIYLSGCCQVWDCQAIFRYGMNSSCARFLNTILYSVPPVIVGSFVSAAAAFAFAKIRFKGRNIVFLILLGAIMIPFHRSMIPQLFSSVNCICCRHHGLSYYRYRKRADDFPAPVSGLCTSSIVDAAKIDGCNYLEMFYQLFFIWLHLLPPRNIVVWLVE